MGARALTRICQLPGLFITLFSWVRHAYRRTEVVSPSKSSAELERRAVELDERAAVLAADIARNLRGHRSSLLLLHVHVV